PTLLETLNGGRRRFSSIEASRGEVSIDHVRPCLRSIIVSCIARFRCRRLRERFLEESMRFLSAARLSFFFVDDLGFRTLHLLDRHSKISVCRNCISDISALNCRGDFSSGRKHIGRASDVYAQGFPSSSLSLSLSLCLCIPTVDLVGAQRKGSSIGINITYLLLFSHLLLQCFGIAGVPVTIEYNH
ncbi:unnamed protein product, partial [Musa acuminata var. zebrina]